MLDYSSYTNVGNRTINEDTCFAWNKDNQNCFLVCDGLGGHSYGEIASKKALEAIGESFELNQEVSLENMESMIQKAQDKVISCQLGNPQYKDIRTTITCVLIDKKRLIAGHVGDSRIYVFRNRKIIYQSADHSMSYALYKSGEIREKDIRNHLDRNIVLRSLGQEWDRPKYEINDISIQRQDAFLLCTDGFWENISEKEMLKSLKKSKSSVQWIEDMTKIIKKRLKGNADNYTAIACIVVE